MERTLESIDDVRAVCARIEEYCGICPDGSVQKLDALLTPITRRMRADEFSFFEKSPAYSLVNDAAKASPACAFQFGKLLWENSVHCAKNQKKKKIAQAKKHLGFAAADHYEPALWFLSERLLSEPDSDSIAQGLDCAQQLVALQHEQDDNQLARYNNLHNVVQRLPVQTAQSIYISALCNQRLKPTSNAYEESLKRSSDLGYVPATIALANRYLASQSDVQSAECFYKAACQAANSNVAIYQRVKAHLASLAIRECVHAYYYLALLSLAYTPDNHEALSEYIYCAEVILKNSKEHLYLIDQMGLLALLEKYEQDHPQHLNVTLALALVYSRFSANENEPARRIQHIKRALQYHKRVIDGGYSQEFVLAVSDLRSLWVMILFQEKQYEQAHALILEFMPTCVQCTGMLYILGLLYLNNYISVPGHDGWHEGMKHLKSAANDNHCKAAERVWKELVLARQRGMEIGLEEIEQYLMLADSLGSIEAQLELRKLQPVQSVCSLDNNLETIERFFNSITGITDAPENVDLMLTAVRDLFFNKEEFPVLKENPVRCYRIVKRLLDLYTATGYQSFFQSANGLMQCLEIVLHQLRDTSLYTTIYDEGVIDSLNHCFEENQSIRIAISLGLIHITRLINKRLFFSCAQQHEEAAEKYLDYVYMNREQDVYNQLIDLFYVLADYYYRYDRHVEAANCFKKIITIDKKSFKAVRILAQLYMNNKLELKDRAALDEGYRLLYNAACDGDAQAQFEIGMLYHTGGNMDKVKLREDSARAAYYFTLAANNSNPHPLAEIFLMMIYAKGNRYKESVALYRSQLESDDLDLRVRALRNLGLLHFNREKYTKALRYLTNPLLDNDFTAQVHALKIYLNYCKDILSAYRCVERIIAFADKKPEIDSLDPFFKLAVAKDLKQYADDYDDERAAYLYGSLLVAFYDKVDVSDTPLIVEAHGNLAAIYLTKVISAPKDPAIHFAALCRLAQLSLAKLDYQLALSNLIRAMDCACTDVGHYQALFETIKNLFRTSVNQAVQNADGVNKEKLLKLLSIFDARLKQNGMNT